MRKTHTNIGELRGALELVVKMLANKGIKVTQSGIQAFVEYDERTLEPLRVNIPMISDQSSPQLVSAIKGFVDHEVAHLLFTDPKIVERAHKERIANLHNIVEDTFIERRMKKAFAGSTRNIDLTLDFAIKHFFQRSFDKHIESYKPGADGDSEARFFVRALATPAIRALAGQEAAQEFMADKWELIPEVHAALLPLTPTLETLDSSLQALKMAHTIREILAEVETQERKDKAEKRKKADPMKKPPKPSESDEGDEGEDDAAPSDSKGSSKLEQSGGYDGDKIFDEPEGEDDEPHEPTEGGECEDTTESSDRTGDSEPSDAKPSEGEESEDEESEGESKEGKESEGEEPEGESQESDGESDGDDSEDEMSPAPSGSEDGSEHEDDFNGDEEGEGREEKSTTDERDAGIDKGNPSPDYLTNDGEIADHKELMDDIENVDTYDAALESVISDGSAASLKDAGYMPFSSEKDFLGQFEIPPGREDHAKKRQQRMRRENSDRIGVMSKSLERMLVSRNRSMFVPGFRSGRLHSAGLYKLQTGDTRVFRRKEEIRTKNTAVMLVVDCSGSMNSRDRIGKASEAAYALCHSLERIGVKTQVMGFTTAYDSAITSAAHKQLDEVIGKNPGFEGGFDRIEPLYLPIFKTFDERLTPAAEQRIAGIPFVSLRNNADGESVEIAGNILRGRPEERKIMIVLSDGQPAMAAVYTSWGFEQRGRDHLKLVVQELEAVGVETLGIGIETNEVREFYPKSIVINDVTELPTKIITELSAMLLN